MVWPPDTIARYGSRYPWQATSTMMIGKIADFMFICLASGGAIHMQRPELGRCNSNITASNALLCLLTDPSTM